MKRLTKIEVQWKRVIINTISIRGKVREGETGLEMDFMSTKAAEQRKNSAEGPW